MADSKKYNGSTWQHSLRKLTTATDTFTTLPVDVYADGNNATVSISGNTVQSGTPTPDNPIMPQGTGERTENLFDEDYTGISATTIYKPIYVGNENATLSIDCPLYQSTGVLFILAGNVSSGISTDANGVWLGHPKTVTPIDGYVTIAFRGYQTTSPVGYHAMLNAGSTPLPYEPYGIKIPISSAATTTPVYLGDVETTRKVKKLVLTGNEDWSYIAGATSPSAYYRFKVGSLNSVVANAEEICTHYQQKTISSSSTDIGFSMQNSAGYNGAFAAFRPYKISSESELVTWKAYLAQQYANGTPVTIWYVLATEETGIVNEPLMKIGDYADTVSGITVPTIIGKDTFDVETTLEPSEVSLSYTGWHDATVKEWDGSQWN